MTSPSPSISQRLRAVNDVLRNLQNVNAVSRHQIEMMVPHIDREHLVPVETAWPRRQHPVTGTGPLCIYVAGPLGPFGPGRAANVWTAGQAGLEVIRRGHHPLIPHLTHHLDAQARALGVHVDYERWMDLDFAWLARADALLYLGPSPGADRELAFACERGLLVLTSIDQVPMLGDGQKGVTSDG